MTATSDRGRPGDDPLDDLLPAGAPIDLDNCAREPIHIPGSVQPRGCLLVVREPELTVVQVSQNLAGLTGVDAPQALGRPLADVLGESQAAVVARAAATFGDLRERNPLDLTLSVAGSPTVVDAVLHREGTPGLLLLELEPADGPRPFSFPNSYLAVRGTVAALNRTSSLGELYDITATAVRELTGFDRVMVYRYDADFNGEVVAEARREDLESFLGLHYPASDIPAQARALYEKNWIRLIDDVAYTPSPLVPVDNPVLGRPTDLTHATLRSVSPIHLEYLTNMGVRASMSISLLRDGRLWGLIACHHYSGPHRPPFGVRAAAEFLGATLSLRLVDRADDERLRSRVGSQDVLGKLTAATFSEAGPLTDALLGAPGLADLLGCDGVTLQLEGRRATQGLVPDEADLQLLVDWVRVQGEDVLVTDDLGRAAPGLGLDPAVVSGVLALTLRDGQYLMWLRSELQRTVDWGGDPHDKAIAQREGDTVRLSPRRSFARWQEIVRGRSARWTAEEVADATALRSHVVETLYLRAQREIRLAETLQRSLLPAMPDVRPWALSAHYEPAAGGRIGGDWYDAFCLGPDRLAVVLGDVAGHGIAAAGTMSQLRNVLRGYLVAGSDVLTAVEQLNDYLCRMLPDAFATLVAGVLHLDDGTLDVVRAGHPLPLLVHEGTAASLPLAPSPPVGVPRARYRSTSVRLDPGDTLLLFSDGLVERRDEELEQGIARLAATGAALAPDATADAVYAEVIDTAVDDDATLLVLRRPPA